MRLALYRSYRTIHFPATHLHPFCERSFVQHAHPSVLWWATGAGSRDFPWISIRPVILSPFWSLVPTQICVWFDPAVVFAMERCRAYRPCLLFLFPIQTNKFYRRNSGIFLGSFFVWAATFCHYTCTVRSNKGQFPNWLCHCVFFRDNLRFRWWFFVKVETKPY